MKQALTTNDYANQIHLHSPYIASTPSGKSKEALLNSLLLALGLESAPTYADKRRALHAKLNTLHPQVLDAHNIETLNQLLQLELNEKQVISADSTAVLNNIKGTALSVWQGDITTIATDAIVNAANSQMLGCFSPLHACIDNAIHSAAGVQLRDDCNTIMQLQGFDEPTGAVKVTRAYNLPSKFVLHTVGPIANGNASPQHRLALAKAYESCLQVCAEMPQINSIAFCGISTGVFGFPAHIAAQIAVNTVSQWLHKHPNTINKVVFNVYSHADNELYKPLVANAK